MSSWHTRLHATLQDLQASARELLEAVRAQREAIRAADPRALDGANRRHATALQRIAELETQRQLIVREGIAASPVARRADLRGKQPTLEQLSVSLAPSEREALLAAARSLRETIAEAQVLQASVGEASARLDRHMQGIVQQAQRRLAGPTTYQRGGRLSAGRTVPMGLDLTR